MVSVFNNIDTEIDLDESLLNYWEDVLNSGLITKDLLTFREVSFQERYKWRMNLYGLFKCVLNIPRIYIYPNIRVNNITNYDFKGDIVRTMKGFYLIDPTFLESQYEKYLVRYKK